MCLSIQIIAETHFVETIDSRYKKLHFGIIYRHPNRDIDNFSSEVLNKIISIIMKEKRECILMGDFNINLSNYESDTPMPNFSSALFQPLILQPTRVTRN